jgi:hypothetical protein
VTATSRRRLSEDLSEWDDDEQNAPLLVLMFNTSKAIPNVSS